MPERRYEILSPTARTGADIVVEDSPRRVRATLAGATVADSTSAKLLHERGRIPEYCFPEADVRMDLAERTDRVETSPTRGTARYWTLRVGERTVDHAMWTYDAPAVADMTGLVWLAWGAMDHWYEEDEEVFVHARDPYKRVDTVASSRRVEVRLGGETVATSTRAVFLFETGLPTRYYLPLDDVRRDLLVASTLQTSCPYKGTASYYSVRIGEKLFEDVVWTYPDPVPECPRIRDLVCFYDERVDAIAIDGRDMPRPRTHFSVD